MSLGKPRQQHTNFLCSKCSTVIPDDHVPLILWENGGEERMWVYCEECEMPIFETYIKVKP
jgi:hypothetical protein